MHSISAITHQARRGRQVNNTRAKEARRSGERRSTSHTSDTQPDTGSGVAAVERALSILHAFRDGDQPLSLGVIATRTGLYKSTILRILETLQRRHFISRQTDGRYSLGSALLYLGGVYERSTDLRPLVEPVLRALAASTGEDASFQIREGQQRIMLICIAGQHTVRENLPKGLLLPLDSGAPGHVLTRYGAATTDAIVGEPVISMGERDPELFGVASPVFGAGQLLLGALCASGTLTRLRSPGRLPKIKMEVHKCARTLTELLGGNASVFANSLER